MPWGKYDRGAVVEEYEDLDPFRDEVAEAVDEAGSIVGYVAATVSVGWELVGWSWWRPRFGRPAEYIDLLFTPLGSRSDSETVHEIAYADWDGRTLTVKGREVRLRWFSGAEAVTHWRRYGWDNQPAPKP